LRLRARSFASYRFSRGCGHGRVHVMGPKSLAVLDRRRVVGFDVAKAAEFAAGAQEVGAKAPVVDVVVREDFVGNDFVARVD